MRFSPRTAGVVAVAFAAIGTMLLISSHAATPSVAVEPENGTLASGASKVSDSGASGGSAVQFAGGNVVPPPPPPTGSIIPSTAKVVFRGDYETGDYSQWDHVQNCGCSYAISLVTGAAAAQGKYSVRFEMHPGDKAFPGGDRDEVSKYGPAEVHDGDERWYDFWMKFDPTFHNPTTDWFIVMQWHDAATGSPPMNLNVNKDGTLWLLNNNTHQTPKEIGPIKRGVWVNYIIHAKFSIDATKGWAEVYQDGKLVVPKHNRANMMNAYDYFKEGMYSPMQAAGNNQIIFYDGPVIYAP